MANNVFECERCNENYNSSERKPLCLQCGHTFCYNCMTHVWISGRRSCPRCKLILEDTVDSLPVIYALIPQDNLDTEKVPSNPIDPCQSHGCDLDYFCSDCGDIICRKCSKQSHAQHNVEFIDDVVERDEISTPFIADLTDLIQTKIGRQTKSLSLCNEISTSVNALQVYEDILQEYKGMFALKIASATQDLETWQKAASKSIQEKRKIFKKLCRYWQERKADFPKQEMSTLSTRLDELSIATQKAQKLTQQLKSHLQQDFIPTAAIYRPIMSAPMGSMVHSWNMGFSE